MALELGHLFLQHGLICSWALRVSTSSVRGQAQQSLWFISVTGPSWALASSGASAISVARFAHRFIQWRAGRRVPCWRCCQARGHRSPPRGGTAAFGGFLHPRGRTRRNGCRFRPAAPPWAVYFATSRLGLNRFELHHRLGDVGLLVGQYLGLSPSSWRCRCGFGAGLGIRDNARLNRRWAAGCGTHRMWLMFAISEASGVFSDGHRLVGRRHSWARTGDCLARLQRVSVGRTGP